MGSEDVQGTHMDALKPFNSNSMTLTRRGGLWTFLANLALCGAWLSRLLATPFFSNYQSLLSEESSLSSWFPRNELIITSLTFFFGSFLISDWMAPVFAIMNSNSSAVMFMPLKCCGPAREAWNEFVNFDKHKTNVYCNHPFFVSNQLSRFFFYFHFNHFWHKFCCSVSRD